MTEAHYPHSYGVLQARCPVKKVETHHLGQQEKMTEAHFPCLLPEEAAI